MTTERRANERQNKLKDETSPYLRSHAHNPVDWFPWSDEAISRARRENKPIFLSIGYSACHWCHVMEKESFEDEETAKLMNDLFVNVKVDREERQDLDHIYMNAVQMMTQHGGWPMSVFLTPDLQPFYAGTYFPNEPRMGMPSFKQVLLGVANIWKTRREDCLKSAKQVVEAMEELNRTASQAEGKRALSLDLVDQAVAQLKASFDPRHGGFGMAPKFFHSMGLQLLLRHWKRTGDQSSLDVVVTTLDHIQRGGIYDQLGGGFHRYSTDPQWLVPHFEKMLYDNALLADTFLEASQATGRNDFAQTARETLDYVLREMTSPDGGFYSTQDADSEGVEGKFYVWSLDEVRRLLDPELAAQFCAYYDVTAEGNWEGHNILRRKYPLEEAAQNLDVEPGWLEDSFATAKRKLLAARSERVPPARDEKVIVAWNGLMIHAMARAHQILGDERYLQAAQRTAHFILEKMTTELKEHGLMLFHTHKDGKSRFTGYVDDYASFASSLVTLYESDFDPRWAKAAGRLLDTMLAHFVDEKAGGFFYTGSHHERLITRPKDTHDGASPSGSSLAVWALARVGLLGRTDFLSKAEAGLKTAEPLMRSIPTAVTQMLLALELLEGAPKEIVVVPGTSEKAREEMEALLQTVRRAFLPNKIVACLSQDLGGEAATAIPLFAGRAPQSGNTVYICEKMSCRAPITGMKQLKTALAALK